MSYYLFLCGGYPDYAQEDETERLADLMRHPLIGVFDDELALIAAADRETVRANERIRRNGRPNLDPEDVRRLMVVH